MILRISFDFDYTLSKKNVQEFAKVFMELGFEVWITTSRRFSGGGWSPYDNDDLYEVAKELGIPAERIIFTNLESKFPFIKDHGFAYHFDDCPTEIEEINKFTNTQGILLKP